MSYVIYTNISKSGYYEIPPHFLCCSQALLSVPFQDPTVLSCVLITLVGSEQVQLVDVHNMTQTFHNLQ